MKSTCLLVCSLLLSISCDTAIAIPNIGLGCKQVCFGEAAAFSQPESPILILVQGQNDDFLVTNVNGWSDVPTPLNIKLSGNEAADDLFALKGIPPEVTLSKGGRINDVWIVRSKDISGLSLTVPPQYAGKFLVSVSRAATPTRPKLTLAFAISIATKPSAGQVQPVAVQPRVAIEEITSSYVPSPADKMLMERATAQLEKGDISGARAIFEVLAFKGNPTAALALGESYDPRVLRRLSIKGIEPNEQKAMEWYRKAAAQGNRRARVLLGEGRE